MLLKKGQYPVTHAVNFKDGEGEFIIEKILTPEQLGDAGRLFAWGTLKPGHSVGWHVHEGDMEICCCVAGEGIVLDDDRQEKPFTVGDVNVVESGCGHEVRNTGDTDLVYVVAVLYPHKGA